MRLEKRGRGSTWVYERGKGKKEDHSPCPEKGGRPFLRHNWVKRSGRRGKERGGQGLHQGKETAPVFIRGGGEKVIFYCA